MATPNAHEWRFIVRSKDRASGTPNNFVAQLPNQIPENCDEVYIRLASIACGTYPSPTDVLMLTTSSYTNGGYAIQPNIPAASATANPYSFSTASAVDVCMNFSTLSTLDTETAGNPHQELRDIHSHPGQCVCRHYNHHPSCEPFRHSAL